MNKIIISCLLLTGMIAKAQVYLTKDTFFGNNGTVTVQTGMAVYNSFTLLIPNINSFFQGNKIFVSYKTVDPANPITSITQFLRLNANGTLDTSFGTNGIVQIPSFESYYFFADNDFIYLNGNKKYLSDGQEDTAFNSNGMQNADWMYKIMLPEGKIFFRADTGFSKFLTNGNPDLSYGTNGNLAISGSIVGDQNSSYNYFFSKDNFIYEFIYPSPGQSNVRKINVDTGVLDTAYGQNGYAQVRNTTIPAAANYDVSVKNTQQDGSFINKLSDGNNIYFTKTNSTGNIDSGFGASGLITGNNSFTNNGNVYTTGNMEPLIYDNKILMPAKYTDAQGVENWGISAYALNGNSLTINGSPFVPLSGSSYETLGYLFAKDNYLYAIHDNNITRYVVQQSATLSLTESSSDLMNAIKFNNPFYNELTVHSKEKIKTVEIKDMSGRTVINGNSDKVNTSTLLKGSYIIITTTESGKVISEKGIKL